MESPECLGERERGIGVLVCEREIERERESLRYGCVLSILTCTLLQGEKYGQF